MLLPGVMQFIEHNESEVRDGSTLAATEVVVNDPGSDYEHQVLLVCEYVAYSLRR